MIDTSFLSQLKRFNLIVKKRVTSNYKGARKSLAHGKGLTLMDFRQYTPGDDLRTVDWKVFARTDDITVRRYEEERSLTVHIVLDSSASMNFGKPFTKFDYSSMLGIGFAYLTMKQNERFEFSTFGQELNAFKPRRGMHQLANMINHLQETKVKGESKFQEMMEKYKRFIKTRSLIIVVSDFLFDIDEIKKGLIDLNRLGRHEIKVIQVLDKAENELDIEGDVKLHDAETGTVLRTNISPRLRKKYQHDLSDHSAKIHDICNRMGMDFYFVTTDLPVFDSFYEILRG